MKYYILIFLCAFSVPAVARVLSEESLADVGPMDNASYSKLEEVFEKASPAKDGDALGWRSGRCFDIERPAVPIPSLLAGLETIGYKYKLIFGALVSNKLGYYESFMEESEGRIEQLTNFINKRAVSAKEENNSLVLSYAIFLDMTDIEVHLKKIVVVERGSEKETEYFLAKYDSFLPFWLGSTKTDEKYCYYFKQIKEAY